MSAQPSSDEAVLTAARIEVESELDQLQLWLPVDRPIFRGRGGLLAATIMFSALALLVMVLSAKGFILGQAAMSTNQILLIILSSLTMLSIVLLTARDVIERLGERLVDRYRPIRKRREKLVLTSRTLRTDRGLLGLDTIQSVSIEREHFTTSLIAQTATGAVPIAQHRSAMVMGALGQIIEAQSARYRQTLRVSGQDPDQPAQIPHHLQQLRQSEK